MPVIQQGNTTSFTTTVQDIMDAVSQDTRGVLSSASTPTLTILLDYVNRVSLQLLRFSRWTFLLSPTYKFVTQTGITDYWIGTVGGSPTDFDPNGSVDTQLNLTNIGQIKRDAVYDRSNSVRLARTDQPPLGQVFELNAHPKMFRNDTQTPNVINIYPPPDYGSKWTYTSVTRSANIATLTTTATNDFQVNEFNNLVWVQGDSDASFVGFWPILSANGQTITFWNPGSNTTSSSGGTASSGYTIEFRYYQARVQITGPSQILQIPDIYTDIVTAGVNWLAFKYLQKDDDAQVWQQVYELGKREMVKDANLFPRAEEYIRPDSLAIIQQTTTGIGLDSGLESSIP